MPADMRRWNTTFKKPSPLPPSERRSPSPPRAFVEPLSPRKLQPLEPAYQYPAVREDAHFTVPPEQQAHVATAKPHAANIARKRGHGRTPSTIDQLAEAALAVSPSYHADSGPSAGSSQQNGHTNGHRPSLPSGAGEPPHKRARSELIPSPLATPYASRPATSYEHNYGWAQHGSQHSSHAYERRVEEAALLLNFRTGGWPSNNAMSPPPSAPPQPVLQRPHAKSFPSAQHQRPTDAAMRAPLWAPFSSHEAPPQHHTLPSPPQVTNDADRTPRASDRQQQDKSGLPIAPRMAAQNHVDKAKEKPTRAAQTPSEEVSSGAQSTDVATSETSDVTKAGRRGWPKGKQRNPGSRKVTAEKAASKRTGTRKKTPDSSKSAKVADEKPLAGVRRRKSLSDGLRRREHNSLASVSTPRAQSVPPDVPMYIRDTPPAKAGRRQAKVTSETICAACSTSRENATAHSEMDEWISCNGCKKWFHIDCAGFKKALEIRDVDKYFCPTCEPTHGKTTYVRKSNRAHASVDYAELQRGVLKTSEESVEHHYIQGIRDGTLYPFEPENFPRMRPEMVTREFLEKGGAFVEPICIPAEWNPRPWDERAGKSKDGEQAHAPDKGSDGAMADLRVDDFEYDVVRDEGQDKLGMVMPEGLTVRHVCNLVGADTPLEVIDVKTQNSGAKWTLGRWADYYEEEGEDKAIRNVISLEVSQTKLGRLLQRPKVVRDIDLQDAVWPPEEKAKGKFPKVQFYCLMSAMDSYTDFHIDFGGSSVYYHILKGQKTFFFIPPKPKHLKAYEEWNESPQQNFTFLGDITKECYRIDLQEGDTMLIPSGWIHAVWTPATSLVIGGNFLTHMSYKNQFKVVEIEKANHTPIKFRYPFFQKVMWYTVIRYLQTDPLPPAVSQLFYEGQQFERRQPIWQDFDGDLAAGDDRAGAHNARYYSQAELDGLPDLVNFIFRTVMIVKGMVEGTSADQMKRVNASIPKGHGDPLELAKTFALWVAWKRGNEDPPAWAHPDALLDHIKDEGPPKRLSARALRELERKEAFAAWRLAPDRQSERMLAKTAAATTPAPAPESGSTAAAAAPAANPGTPAKTSSPAPPPPSQAQPPTPSQHHPNHQPPAFAHQPAPAMVPSAAFIMNSMPGQHISTPKTSVLGPKRVACDACRKRRIRCKHKDLVVQASPPNAPSFTGISSFQSTLAPELHGELSASPPDGQLDGVHPYPNGGAQINGHGPQPGTNAYVSANIPMTMNGVPIFGEIPKRGRSKACFECRKSKRRCVHDENGNVDPVKAAETPVPRGSTSKKRPFAEDGSLLQVKKQRPVEGSLPSPSHSAGQAGILMPQTVSHGPTHQPSMRPESRPPPPVINEPAESPSQQHPEIDPSLFSYPEPADQSQYANGSYPYPAAEQQAQQNPYEISSLEQIANEVLDMNGRGHEVHHEDYIDAQLNAPLPHHNHNPILPNGQHYGNRAAVPVTNGPSKTDESVDSAVSLSKSEAPQHRERSVDDRLRDALAADSVTRNEESPTVQPSVETNGHVDGKSTLSSANLQTSPKDSKFDFSGLPLYRPPAPMSQSPEQTKRQPVTLSNGTSESSHKPKKVATPATSPTLKRAKADGPANVETSPQSTADEEFAKQLQQEERGLRRRSRQA